MLSRRKSSCQKLQNIILIKTVSLKTREEKMRTAEERRQLYLKFLKRTRDRLKKLGVKDPVTAGEISRRDRFVQKWLKIPFWRKHGLRANHITYAGFVLVTAYNILMYFAWFKIAFATGFAGVLTDLIDGPLARWKNPETGKDDVTGWGTFLDHSRDYYYAFSFGWDAFFKFGRTSPFEIFLAALILLSYLAIFISILIKYQILSTASLAPFFRRMNKNYLQDAFRRFSDFCLAELQTTFYGRAQFVLLATGATSLFLGKFLEINYLINFAYAVLGAEIGYGFRNLVEEHIMEE